MSTDNIDDSQVIPFSSDHPLYEGEQKTDVEPEGEAEKSNESEGSEGSEGGEQESGEEGAEPEKELETEVPEGTPDQMAPSDPSTVPETPRED